MYSYDFSVYNVVWLVNYAKTSRPNVVYTSINDIWSKSDVVNLLTNRALLATLVSESFSSANSYLFIVELIILGYLMLCCIFQTATAHAWIIFIKIVQCIAQVLILNPRLALFLYILFFNLICFTRIGEQVLQLILAPLLGLLAQIVVGWISEVFALGNRREIFSLHRVCLSLHRGQPFNVPTR